MTVASTGAISRLSSMDARNSVTSFISRLKRSRFFRVFRIVLEQLVVFLQRRSAAGGVGDDGVETAIEHGVDILPRQLARLVANSGMNVQRAAAGLARGDHTSQPFFCSTRTVASFRRAKETLAMQPAINATRYRCSPSAGNVWPIWRKKNGGSADGASCSRSPQRAQQLHEPEPRSSFCRPLAWYT